MKQYKWRNFSPVVMCLAILCGAVLSAQLLPEHLSAKSYNELRLDERIFASAKRSDEKETPANASTLKLALVHLNVQYKQPEINRKNLVALNRRAAQMGADIILNTEMAISGYSFRSRSDISEFIETEDGKTLAEIAQIAKQYGTYVGVALAERDDSTDIYYNTAFVLDPEGKQICKYRKISAEKRWARPGDPKQAGTFDTPWGRMGVLICSDTYHGLIPRSMALKGVNLLWVPANWPPGGINPKDLWRARAMENGFFIAACNRTGKDRKMDCREGASVVYGPDGREYLSGSSAESQVFFVEIPLNSGGKLSNTVRRKILSERKPNYFRSIYLDPYTEDFTNFYKLPEPGTLNVICVVPENESKIRDVLEEAIQESDRSRPLLVVLPMTSSSALDTETMRSLASRYGIAICVALNQNNSVTDYLLATPDGLETFISEEGIEKGESPFRLLHYGPAAIAMIPYELFKHPEFSAAFSKLGGDLVVLSEDVMSSESRLLSRIKATAGVAITVCANNGGMVYEVPNVHESWKGKSMGGTGLLTYEIDTNVTRKKQFQNRIDYDILLKKNRK